MSAEHNHKPRCCCDPHRAQTTFDETCPECQRSEACPACPVHGVLVAPYTEQETTK